MTPRELTAQIIQWHWQYGTAKALEVLIAKALAEVHRKGYYEGREAMVQERTK